MNFELRHSFDAPIARVASAMMESEFLSFLSENHPKVRKITPLKREEDLGSLRREVLYQTEPAFDRVGPKTVPAQWFEFIESSVWDPTTYRLTFHNVPTHTKLKALVRNEGVIQLREIEGNRTERIATGKLEVKLPLLMKPLAAITERLIYAEAQKLLEGEAEALQKWLNPNNA